VRQLEATRAARIERGGDYWTVAFDGRAVSLHHLAGLADLSALLERPGKEIHVLDLASTEGSGRPPAGGRVDLLDDQAKAEYRQRLDDLEGEHADAVGNNDQERAARLAEERDRLVEELSGAYGLGGRARAFNEEGERARKAVTKRLRVAIDRIDDAHPSLGRHLHATIRTGMYCAYEPDPLVHWDIST
jgi:hypothetical protein